MTKTYNNVYIYETSSIVGKKEYEGPLGKYFDSHIDDLYIGCDSFMKAEAKLLEKSVEMVIKKSNITNIDLLVSGDLINQIGASNIVSSKFDIPFLGIYNACSNYVVGLIVASHFIEGMDYNNIIVATSSHNMDAERQFRNPNEYGANKPVTITSTITGAAASIVTKSKSRLRVMSSTTGRTIDANQTNPSDMGSIMAPAAYEVIKKHFNDLGINEDYYDVILSGDLGSLGSLILDDLLLEDNIDIRNKHFDCGKLIYDLDNGGNIMGGSGCGCIATVFNSYIKDLMYKGTIKKVLLVGTGALLNESTFKQKLTIPGIAHAVGIEVI